MRVIVDEVLFGSAETSQMDLIRLLQLAFEERHIVQTDPLQAPAVGDWLASLPENLRDECTYAIDASIELDSRRRRGAGIRIANVPKPVWEMPEPTLPLGEALELLNHPFRVLVEDRNSDGNFLLTTATSQQRQMLQELLDKHWVVLEHAGGISSMLRRVRELSGWPRERYRTWALFDSDALAPAKPSKISEQLKRYCERKRIPHHQLKRRESDNYLPVPALDYWARRPQHAKAQRQRLLRTVRAFSRLTTNQRHHFNMKAGFDADRKRNDPSCAHDLYEALDDDHRQVLAGGFGGQIDQLFSDQYVRKQEHWFANDGQRDELLPMIDDLLSHI